MPETAVTEGTPATPATPVTPSTSGTPATPAVAAATPATPTGFTYTEDRSKWIPPHRLNEVTTKASTAEAALAEANRKILALAGGGTDQNDKSAKVKEEFLKLYPQLEPLLGLTKDQIAALTETPRHLDRVTQQEQREAAKHGKAQIAIISSRVADVIGAEKLTDDQQTDLRDNFAAWFRNKAQKELQASNGESSETLRRYEEGDEALLDEFVKRYTANWVEPARRKATAGITNRTNTRVPDSTGRSQVSSVKRPETFKSLDERIEYGAKLLKEQGHQFGGG